MTAQRYLALDVGTKRIGVAVSDLLGVAAHGVETYARTGDDEKDAEHFVQLAERYRPVTIVVGMPRNMDGSYGVQAEYTRAFAEVLRQKFDGEIEFYDERLTTAAATKVLLDADLSRKKRKKVVDKLAAVLILESYMTYRANRAARELREHGPE